MSSSLARNASNILVLKSTTPSRTCPAQALKPCAFSRLIVLSTPLRGMEFVLKTELVRKRWVLGAGPRADFKIIDGTLHANHLLIEKAGEDWFVSCHADCWGFFVNDEPVETAVVEQGDRLRVGRHELIFMEATANSGLGAEEDRGAVGSWWRRLYPAFS